MTLREWLLLVHVLTAVVWLGGGVVLVLIGHRTLRRGDASSITGYIADSELAGGLFGISSALVLASGVWLVIEVNAWEFDQPWILVSLVITAILFVIGAAYHAPRVKRRLALAKSKGGAAPEVVTNVSNWLRLSVVELLVMACVVWLMIDKPWL